MNYTRNNRVTIGIACMVMISLLMMTGESSWSAETSHKKNADTYMPVKERKDNQASDKQGHKVIVFYFHGNVRCFTCERIEQLTMEAVNEEFAEEMKKGVVELKVINVEEAKNNHFIKDYQLYTKSVIVSDLKQGKQDRWKNLQRVWELVRNDEAFKRYVQKEINEYLEGKQS
jgi:hypothetical protein